MMSRPQIQHLAIMSRDPEKLASFYEKNFQMERIHSTKTGGVFLTDGHLTLALLPHRLDGEAACGINHFGFKVDSIEQMSDLLVDDGLEQPKARPAHRPYAEFRAVDPDGNQFDLSEHGYQRVEYTAERDKKKETVDA
jgi:catechol 2,3-dioxygenase-like lactoylglutathione lyase family enzyme